VGDEVDLFVELSSVQNTLKFFNGKNAMLLNTQNGFILHFRRRTRYFRTFLCFVYQMSHVSTSVKDSLISIKAFGALEKSTYLKHV